MPVASEHAGGGPHYFAWARADETTFGVEHHRYDEYIRSYSRDHAEGGIPTLTIDIKNPRVGLLGPGRETWAWFAIKIDGVITPRFFGQLVGIPSDILGNVITLVFLAKALDYEDQKQAVAQTLKLPPNYDPLFLDVAHRDDPDAVLEGYPARWHVHPTTLAVSISDILVGEDGEEVFTAGDVRYASVQFRLADKPLRSVTVIADVAWTQTATGVVDFGGWTFSSYTGDGLISDWPKPLASLGGGWSVEAATAIDVYGTGQALTASWSDNYQNKAKEHENGDTLSISISASIPQLAGPRLDYILTEKAQTGIFDPYADPQVNIAQSYANTTVTVPLWQVKTTLVLRYEAKRQRSERLKFTLTSDLQDILATRGDSAADIDADESEIINLSGTDVGLPLFDVLDWDTVKGTQVARGQIVTDGTSFQVALGPATAGTDEPDFSELVGELTIDGAVTWASLGVTLFPADVPGWVANDTTPLGQVIFPKLAKFIAWTTLLPPAPAPTVGVSVGLGLIVKRANGASYQIVTTAGTTGLVEPNFSDTRGVTTADNDVIWTSLGPELPGSAEYLLCTARTGSGSTGALEPTFAVGAGATTLDNEVTWTSLGLGGSFIGVPIGDVARASYFPIDRGVRSIEYCLCVASAHLKARARPVQISFDCHFSRAAALTCRNSARLFDGRLPGGNAMGKIVNVSLKGDGPSGKFNGTITIACAIGRGNVVTASAGTPSYVQEGYVARGYQFYEDAVTVLESGDVGYSRPVDAPIDDGLVFPLTKAQAVAHEEIHGSLTAQRAAIVAAFRSEGSIANLAQAGSPQQSIQNQQTILALNKTNLAAAFKQNPIWLDLQLKSLEGTFAHEYEIDVTVLTAPKGIDLEAA